MALFLDNVGGAWDNAKKYVEVRTGTVVTSAVQTPFVAALTAMGLCCVVPG